MEFHEKLQKLRKNKGLTQEELAEVLFVSRTAISKWESGRGYPSIDSLKAISAYFSVSIDDLLSGEKLLFIAEEENKSNIQKMCDLLFGITDIMSLLMIVFPLYPNEMNGHVYSVNLLEYVQITTFNRCVYWICFVLLIMTGMTKILLLKKEKERTHRFVTESSMMIHILAVLFLALAREAYAIVLMFLFLVIKAMVLYNCSKKF